MDKPTPTVEEQLAAAQPPTRFQVIENAVWMVLPPAVLTGFLSDVLELQAQNIAILFAFALLGVLVARLAREEQWSLANTELMTVSERVTKEVFDAHQARLARLEAQLAQLGNVSLVTLHAVEDLQKASLPVEPPAKTE